jgi:hypothetical protein
MKATKRQTDVGNARLYRAPGRSALASKGLFNTRRALRVGRFKTVQQAIGAGFKKLRQPCKGRQGDWICPALDMTYSFPVYANQFGKAFLRHVGLQPRLTDALAKQAQDLMVGHVT